MTLRNRIISEERRPILKKLLAKNSFARAIEVHNGISAIIGNDINIENEGTKLEFDALWISSLTDSAAKGHPDAEILGFDSRLDTINEIAEVTNKPMILDGDTGRDFTYFEYKWGINKKENKNSIKIFSESYKNSTGMLVNKENFEEFLKFKGDSPNNYQPIYLSAAYAAMKNEDEKISQTELKLARKAVEKGCRYVTNLDYCLNCIAGTGLVKK